MRNRRLVRRLLCLVLLFCLDVGCQSFQGDHSLSVLVRDAETKKPIATAEVYLCQILKQDEVAPCHSSSFTQSDGVARLRSEPGGTNGIQVQAVAQGYLPEKLDVPAEQANVRRPPTGPQNKPTDAGRSPDVVVEVYAEPAFRVELLLPPGYRGPIKAEIQIQDNLPLPPGQRCFRFPVSASGDVQIVGPSLLQRVPAQEYQARYANSPVLGTAMDAEKIGFRWLKGAGNRHFFVVGTQLDYETLHQQMAPDESQMASGSWDDGSRINRHKYRYGKMTAKNYEK
jgi:hypothetical protein